MLFMLSYDSLIGCKSAGGGNVMGKSDTFDFDYVIIGSGFGGSVSALRLSEKGYTVAVLEKGKRWQKQDFPKTNWNTRKYLWLPQLGCYGYQMLTFLKHVLVMQTDENHLRLEYRPRWWRLGGFSLNSTVPPGQNRAPAYIPIANEVTRRLAEKMDGIPLSFIGEALFNASSTAHILGGCCMGPTPDKGVVGINGEVFGYPNLFVADGSVVPANLGVNPSLTITALSEFIMSQRPAR